MITFLIEARRTFHDVDHRLTATVGKSALQQWGVTPEVVDTWHQDMIRKIECGESKLPLATVESARISLLKRARPSDS